MAGLATAELAGGWRKDGDLHLPESGNKLPDLPGRGALELSWLLEMQVPEGYSQAGLVLHKLHDTDWSALGTLPVLGVHASATPSRQHRGHAEPGGGGRAGRSRVRQAGFPSSPERCLSAAKRAWAAAEAHPDLIISNADNQGGGAYDDATLSDERFWAATELSSRQGQGFLHHPEQSPALPSAKGA